MYTGYVIPPYYDSMCAKLTVWNLSWEGVIARGRRALNDMTVYGVKTTIPYYLEILQNQEFRDGRFDTSFVEMHPDLIQYDTPRHKDLLAAAIASAIAAHEGL
jgi:pyruvate carboxylase subunit A